MFKALSDFMIFIAAVFFINAVVSIVITKVRTNRILKEDESLYDMTKFYTSKWGNENARLVVGGVLCYLCIACVCAWFKLVPVLVIASIAIIIFYIRVNVVMMNYVDKKVHEKK